MTHNMRKGTLVHEIFELCEQREYDAAIEKTNELKKVSNAAAIKAHLLVMEHECAYHKKLASEKFGMPSQHDLKLKNGTMIDFKISQ